MMNEPIPVTVVTGFLGAGKSTLLEHWLRDLPRHETAVLINEQGEVGIDGTLLAERASRIREITGGCVCCVAQQELDAALTEFAELTPSPTRIIVETSGAASPAGVIRALTWGTARAQLRLDGVVTVLDAARARETMAFALTIEQLGFADIVVLSHIDQCVEDHVRTLQDDLVAYAPGAVLTRAKRGQLDEHTSLLDLLEARGGVLRTLPAEDGAADRHGIDAVSLVHEGELHEARFGDWVESALGAVEARILRIKGILAVQGVDARVIVQGVGEAIEVTLGLPWNDVAPTSRLVILGLALDEADLRAGFEACAIRPATDSV